MGPGLAETDHAVLTREYKMQTLLDYYFFKNNNNNATLVKSTFSFKSFYLGRV